METGPGSLLIFLMLGLAASAGPAHFGFRALAFRQQIDKAIPLPEGGEDGGWLYSWWLMCWRHRAARDHSLNFFGGIAAGSGWLALFGAVGLVLLIGLQ